MRPAQRAAQREAPEGLQEAVGLDTPATKVSMASLAGQSNDDGFAMAFDD